MLYVTSLPYSPASPAVNTNFSVSGIDSVELDGVESVGSFPYVVEVLSQAEKHNNVSMTKSKAKIFSQYLTSLKSDAFIKPTTSKYSHQPPSCFGGFLHTTFFVKKHQSKHNAQKK